MYLDDFVRDACALADDPEAKRSYVKMMRCAVNAMRDISININASFSSKKFTVKENLTVVMPEDCIDVIQAGKVIIYNDAQQFVYPIGKRDLSQDRPFEMIIKPNAPKGCPQAPDAAPNSNVYYNYEGIGQFWYMPYWFGEMYGYQEDRFYGYFDYEKDTNTVVFAYNGLLTTGDEVVLKYQKSVADDALMIVPDDVRAMLLQRTYYYFYMTSKPQLSQLRLQDFRREITMYKRNVSRGYSYEDYINWITSAYSNVPR